MQNPPSYSHTQGKLFRTSRLTCSRRFPSRERCFFWMYPAYQALQMFRVICPVNRCNTSHTVCVSLQAGSSREAVVTRSCSSPHGGSRSRRSLRTLKGSSRGTSDSVSSSRGTVTRSCRLPNTSLDGRSSSIAIVPVRNSRFVYSRYFLIGRHDRLTCASRSNRPIYRRYTT